ncbi:hypothetical protein EDB83DRAFT_2521560 [Lactarius deliciosus]|nr:hypothetical protein EDB83DRAFT_2521560 [Lactarius deliciosus]
MDVRRQGLSLNKSIPHKTEWVEFPDVAALAQRIGAPHTVLLHGGQPLYTVPILHDPTTERSLSGSLQIALNLKRIVGGALAPLLLVHIWAQLNEGSKLYFRTARERMLGQSLESLTLPGALREALKPFAKDADAREQSEAFLLGERETYADVVAACWLAVGRRIWGTDTQEWAELETWHGGRWGRLTRAFKRWEYVDTPFAPTLQNFEGLALGGWRNCNYAWLFDTGTALYSV